MKGKVFIDRHNIINWVPEDPTGDVEGTKLACDVMQNLLEEHGPMNILVDLTKAPLPDLQQRTVVIDAIKKNFQWIKRIAIFGESPIMKVVASFIIMTAGYGNVRFFSSRNQARAWLEEETA